MTTHTMKTQKLPIRVFAGGVGLLAMMGIATVQVVGARAATHAKIGTARANAIVLKRFPGTLTAKTTLENEEGTWQYGVMVRSGRTLREVMVDANSGKIANVETTTAGKEQVEKRQDEAAAHSRRHGKTSKATTKKTVTSHEKGERDSKGKHKD